MLTLARQTAYDRRVNQDSSFDTPRHPVRLVANLTGLSPHVLRAWERRYGVVAPHRSQGGQRLYSDHDVERLRRLKQLTGRGHSISRVAGLSLADLERLEEQVPPSPVTLPAGKGQSSAAADVVGEALGAVGRFDAQELQGVLQRGAITLGGPVFLNEVVAPAVEAVGDGWSSGALSVAQEHMSTAVFRRVLEWQLGAYRVSGDMPRLVVATPPGEAHELGALMVAVSAVGEGWGITYLGPDLPVARAARGCPGHRGPSRRAQHRLLSQRRRVAGGGQGNSGGTAPEYAVDDRRSRGKPLEKGNGSFRGDRAGLAARGSGHAPGAERGGVSQREGLVLVTGATGYVGGRVRRALEGEGQRPLRCMARRPEYLRGHAGPRTQVVAGDVLEPASLGPALEGVHTAYYLIHSMGSGREYDRSDREGARCFAAAARAAGIARIVYLGGLGHGSQLSRHLASRQEVGLILRESGVPTVEFRASIVLGSGSLSFELVRALVEKLPVMVTPSWVDTTTQPIGIEDLVAYLVAALDAAG